MTIPARVFLLAMLLGIFLNANAADSNSIKIPGLGATTCQDIANIGERGWRDKSRRTELGAWAQGYLGGLITSYAMQISSYGGESNNANVNIEYGSEDHWIWLVNHCTANPSQNLAEAVMALFRDTFIG